MRHFRAKSHLDTLLLARCKTCFFHFYYRCRYRGTHHSGALEREREGESCSRAGAEETVAPRKNSGGARGFNTHDENKNYR